MKRWLVWILVPLLILLQQDYWQWDNSSLLFGFLPYALAWHIGVSLAATGAWLAIALLAWPDDRDLIRPAQAEEATHRD